MNEQQFEECSLEEATHVEMGGKVYELGPNDGYETRYQVLKYNMYYIEIYMESAGWQLIQAYAFPILGIKPMREIKSEPIEFEATFVKHDGQWHTLAILNDNFAYLNNKRVRFRCVQIVEED